jgi:hypothetical protein
MFCHQVICTTYRNLHSFVLRIFRILLVASVELSLSQSKYIYFPLAENRPALRDGDGCVSPMHFARKQHFISCLLTQELLRQK